MHCLCSHHDAWNVDIVVGYQDPEGKDPRDGGTRRLKELDPWTTLCNQTIISAQEAYLGLLCEKEMTFYFIQATVFEVSHTSSQIHILLNMLSSF